VCVGQNSGYVTEIGVRTDYGFGPAVVGNVIKIMGRINRCDGNGHRPDLLNSQPADDPLDTVGNIQNNFLVRFDAFIDQGSGKPVGQILYFAVRKAAAKKKYGRVVFASLDCGREG